VICVESKSCDSNEDDISADHGTADALRSLFTGENPGLKQEDYRDLLIVSGDFVSDVTLGGMLDQHLYNEAALTCLMTDIPLTGPVPGTKERKKYRDLVALTPDAPSERLQQLLFLCEEEDYGQIQTFDQRIFSKFPSVLLTANYKDVHVQAWQRKTLVDLLELPLSSLKVDLIPHLLERQYKSDAQAKCFGYCVGAEDANLVAQCNSVATYFEANRAVHRLLNNWLPDSMQNNRDYKALGATVTESSVDPNARLGRKSVVKKSCIGPGCSIGENAKVEGSLLVGNVIFNNGASVKNSILFTGVELGDKAEVSMCVVAPGQKIPMKKKHANEQVGEQKEVGLMSDDDG